MPITPQEVAALRSMSPDERRRRIEAMTDAERMDLKVALTAPATQDQVPGNAPARNEVAPGAPGAQQEIWQRKLKPFTLSNGLTTDLRPDGFVWLDESKGFTGDKGPGWYKWTDKGWSKGPDRPESTFLEKAGATMLQGFTKSMTSLGKMQAEGTVSPDGTVLVQGRGGMPFATTVQVSPEEAQRLRQGPGAVQQAIQQNFQEKTGGGIVPSIAAELADPANLVGGQLGAQVGRKIVGRSVPAMLARGAASGTVAAVPAAVLRPGATPTSILGEMAGGGAAGAVLEPVVELGKAKVGEWLMRRRATDVQPGQIPAARAIEPPVAGAPAAVPEPAVAPPIESLPTMTQAQQAEAVAVARGAVGHGPGAEESKAALAALANVDPQAMQAAEALGVDLPTDVFSQSPQVRALAGLSRSQPGSEAQAAWSEYMARATKRADEVLAELGTVTEQGVVSPGAASMRVRDQLVGARDELVNQAEPLFEKVNDAIGRTAKVDLPNTKATVDGLLAEVGGNPALLGSTEREILKAIQAGELTYGSLLRLRQRVGQSIGGPKAFLDTEDRVLRQLYGALNADQSQAALQYGGEELATALEAANTVYAKAMQVQDRLTKAFGQEANGSIASLMRQAITEGKGGGNKAFSKLQGLLQDVPEDMRRETIVTALADVTRAKTGQGRGQFGFSEFAKLYPNLRANPEVYSEITKALGPNSHELLQNLFTLSKKVYESGLYTERTGRALSGMMQQLVAQGRVARAVSSTPGRAATTAVVGAVAPGGPMTTAAVAGAANILADALDTAGTKTGDKLAKLFASTEFRDLALQVAKDPEAINKAANRLAYSKVYQEWAKTTKGAPRDPRAVVAYFNQSIKAGLSEPEEANK